MKHKWELLLIFAVMVQTGWAQNTVESIRERYTAIKERISSRNGTNPNDGAEWLECYHMEARQFLPATGGHIEDVYMYWDEREEEKIYPSHYLTFATKKFNFAAREYYQEMMFDPDGRVAFIYAYDPMWSPDDGTDDEEYEFRFYLSKGKLIKGTVRKRTDSNQAFTEVYSGATLRKEYMGYFQSCMGSAESIKKLFIAIEEEAYDYTE